MAELADRIWKKGIDYAMRMLPCRSELAGEIIGHLSQSGYKSADELRARMEAWRRVREAHKKVLELECAARERALELEAQ